MKIAQTSSILCIVRQRSRSCHEIFSPFTTIQTVKPYISALAHAKLVSCCVLLPRDTTCALIGANTISLSLLLYFFLYLVICNQSILDAVHIFSSSNFLINRAIFLRFSALVSSLKTSS